MFEKIAAGAVTFLVSTIMVFFWKNQSAQDKRMTELKESTDQAHYRITQQSERNNEKFARRDDVTAMEARIIESINSGLNGIKEDIRSMSKLK